MNRLIKFRLYCPYNKEMYYDGDENFELKIQDSEFSYVPIEDDSYCFYSNIADDLENECLNIIPMQFTGLLDKNGNEIFEGDIISYSFQNGFGSIEHRGVVTYTAPRWHLDKTIIDLNNTSKGYIKDMSDGEYWLSRTRYDSTVIGNIYENPELLNNGKD